MLEQTIYEAVNKARVSLTHGKKTFVIVGDNKLLHYSDERGLKPVLDLIEHSPEKLQGAIVGDKLVGKAAAFLCIHAGVKALFALWISDEAIDLLEKHDCIATWKEMVPYIVERDLTSRYKLDLLLADVEDPAEAYQKIKEYMKASEIEE